MVTVAAGFVKGFFGAGDGGGVKRSREGPRRWQPRRGGVRPALDADPGEWIQDRIMGAGGKGASLSIEAMAGWAQRCQVHLLPSLVGPFVVGRDGLGLGWPAGSAVGPVAFAVEQQVVAGVDDPVQDGLADHGVGEERIPVGGGAVGGQHQRVSGATEALADSS